MKAYHFHNGHTLRDGRPLPPLGQKLVHTGPLVLCESGLHFSRHPFDALQYAPGPFLDIVHIGGTVLEPAGENKGVCSERTRIQTIDATLLLRKAARMWAFEVLPLWTQPVPAVVKTYLETGDESLRTAALAAALAAARAAALAAAGAAARAAARAAAGAAGWAAGWAAAQREQRKQFLTLIEAAFIAEDSRVGAMNY